MNGSNNQHRAILERIADRAMLERGLLPAFSAAVLQEVATLAAPARTAPARSAPKAGKAAPPAPTLPDLRARLWCSIDNDDSLDLDQLTVAEKLPGGRIKVLAAIADVDALVKSHSAIDEHARQNTTSVYTAAKIFPMLPEKLSTDLTSLNFSQDRQALVLELVVAPDGSVQDSAVYLALVRNKAKLAYNSVAAWLEGRAPAPAALAAVPGLDENLRWQDDAAQRLLAFRHARGALSLSTLESKPVFDGDQIRDLEVEEKNRAKELIENIMIAANSVTAGYLESKNYPVIRRVVRTPKRWDRIVALAAEHGARLPETPDSKALEGFLVKQKAADPLRFPDLSLAVVKLLGAGEYVADPPGEEGPGHFGLAVRDYAHTTAPNRRYTDLVTHRLVKAAMQGRPNPYTFQELSALALHCTQAEDTANKVERQVNKSAAALLLQARIGEQFDALVTGAAPKGTWVRLLNMPVEGRLTQGFERVDVGDRLRVQLLLADVEQGFIDFKRVR